MSNHIPIVYTCFPEGKHKVLTMSFDDGRVEDRRLVELFNQYGIKGTFNLNAGIDWTKNRIPFEEYRSLYQGHEVASHTYTHPTIARCPMEENAQQLLEDRKMLESLVGYPVRGMAYPNGSYSSEIKQLFSLLGIKYARVVGSTDQFGLPQDLYEWKATCHYCHNLLPLADEFLQLKKTQYLYMMYVWGHSYELTERNNWDLMEEFVRKISNQKDIWYATNIQYVDYMEAAQRIQYFADSSYAYNPSAISVWVAYHNQIIEIPAGKQVQIMKEK